MSMAYFHHTNAPRTEFKSGTKWNWIQAKCMRPVVYLFKKNIPKLFILVPIFSARSARFLVTSLEFIGNLFALCRELAVYSLFRKISLVATIFTRVHRFSLQFHKQMNKIHRNYTGKSSARLSTFQSRALKNKVLLFKFYSLFSA